MFLYICENKRPDRTGENHYTTTSRSNPPTIEELMTHKKKSRLQRKRKTKIRSLGIWTRSFFLFALLVERKKLPQTTTTTRITPTTTTTTTTTPRSHSHYLRQIIKSEQPRQTQPLNPTYHRAADPRTSYLPTTNQTQLVSE